MGALFRIGLGAVALFFVVAATPLRAHPYHALVGGDDVKPGEVRIEGVLDGRRDRIDLAAVSVRINGVPARQDEKGHFAASVPRATYYFVEVEGAKIFATQQTFGNAEITEASCHCLAIPAIEPVARKKGRVELFFGGDSMAGRRYFEARRGRTCASPWNDRRKNPASLALSGSSSSSASPIAAMLVKRR